MIHCNSKNLKREHSYGTQGRFRVFVAAESTPPSSTPPNHGPRRTGHGEIFVAGSVVRESGIYEVLHDLEHRTSHEAVMIADDRFPACEVCDERVRYRVVRTAPYIFSDEDFEEPQG